MFDTTGTLTSNAFKETFTGTPLSVASVENVLVSLDANGQSNITLGLDNDVANNIGPAPKSTWTAAANIAFDNLVLKGWTISYNP